MAAKRRVDVSDYSDESVYSDDDYLPDSPPSKKIRANSSGNERDVLKSSRQNISSSNENVRRRERKTKCNSKNAIVARENRMKKKLYINGLEKQISFLKDESKKIKMTLSSQIDYVRDLEREVVYLKNVIANSKEIGALIGNICTGSSLQLKSSLSVLQKNNNNKYCNNKTESTMFQERRYPLAKKTPWPFENEFEDNDRDNRADFLTSGTSVSSSLANEDDSPYTPLNLDVDSYFSDENDFPFVYNDVPLSPLISNDENYQEDLKNDDDINEHFLNSKLAEPTISEHNYSSKIPELNLTDGLNDSHGVCIHISNKRLSLEFCSKCNEKAITNWEAVTP